MHLTLQTKCSTGRLVGLFLGNSEQQQFSKAEPPARTTEPLMRTHADGGAGQAGPPMWPLSCQQLWEVTVGVRAHRLIVCFTESGLCLLSTTFHQEMEEQNKTSRFPWVSVPGMGTARLQWKTHTHRALSAAVRRHLGSPAGRHGYSQAPCPAQRWRACARHEVGPSLH